MKTELIGMAPSYRTAAGGLGAASPLRALGAAAAPGERDSSRRLGAGPGAAAAVRQ
ncbi:hypothetical protein GCM10027440_42460 [Nocardiopsis coralliicola]